MGKVTNLENDDEDEGGGGGDDEGLSSVPAHIFLKVLLNSHPDPLKCQVYSKDER